MYLEQSDPCRSSSDAKQSLRVHPLVPERLAASLQDNSHVGPEETKVLLQGTAKHWPLFGVVCGRREEGEGEELRGVI